MVQEEGPKPTPLGMTVSIGFMVHGASVRACCKLTRSILAGGTAQQEQMYRAKPVKRGRLSVSSHVHLTGFYFRLALVWSHRLNFQQWLKHVFSFRFILKESSWPTMRYMEMDSKWEQLEDWRQKYTPDMNRNTHRNAQPHPRASVRVKWKTFLCCSWRDPLDVSKSAQQLELLIAVFLSQASETGEFQFTDSK